MFICDCCKETTKPHESCHIIILAKKDKIYEQQKSYGYGEERGIKIIQTKGWEIAKESKLCEKCYEKSRKN